MIVTTTNSIEGKKIKTYLGVVSGEAIMGANVFRDVFASITDIIGGRSGTYESQLKKARQISMKEMQEEAQALGGEAVVGVDLDYEVIRDGMLMVTAAGTAVVFER
jgi:uncharacterized protein YbjQ (UPF0145 family)